MTLHYMEFLHRLSDSVFIGVVSDWIRSNPPYRRGDPAWFSYTVATRIIVWLQELAVRQSRLDERFLALVSHSLFEQLRFLRRNLELDVRGNHLIRNVRALQWGATAFEGKEALDWQETAWKILVKEIDEQILGDGVHFERSPAYHALVLSELLEIHYLLDDEDRRSLLRPVLRAMMVAATELTGPAERGALFNDGGEETGPPLSALTSAWERFSEERLEPSPLFHLSESGFSGAREEGVYLVLQGGQIGADHLPAHAHGDIFSFELTVAGTPVVADSGTYEYAEGHMRAYCRGTAAHSTLTVDGRDQAEFWSQFRVGRRYPPTGVALRTRKSSLHFRGTFPGYASLIGDDIRHHRRLHWDRRELSLTVRDRVTGQGDHRVESRIHLHPEIRVEKAGEEIKLIRDRTVASLVWQGASLRIESGWHCPRMGTKMRRPVIVLHRSGPLPARFSYTIRCRP